MKSVGRTRIACCLLALVTLGCGGGSPIPEREPITPPAPATAASGEGSPARPPDRSAPDSSMPPKAGKPLDAGAKFQGRTLAEWVKDLSAQDEVARSQAADAVAKYGSNAKSAVPALSKILADPKDFAWFNAVDAVKALGPSAGEAVGTLSQLLRNRDPGVRLTVAYALGKLGPAAEKAVPGLVALLDDKAVAEGGGKVRDAALAALEQVGKYDIRAVFEAERKRKLSDLELSHVLESLGPDDGSSADGLVEEVKRKGDTVFHALSGLKRIGKSAAPAAPALRSLLEDKKISDNLRKSITETLAAIDPEGKAKAGPPAPLKASDVEDIGKALARGGFDEKADWGRHLTPFVRFGSKATADQHLKGGRRGRPVGGGGRVLPVPARGDLPAGPSGIVGAPGAGPQAAGVFRQPPVGGVLRPVLREHQPGATRSASRLPGRGAVGGGPGRDDGRRHAGRPDAPDRRGRRPVPAGPPAGAAGRPVCPCGRHRVLPAVRTPPVAGSTRPDRVRGGTQAAVDAAARPPRNAQPRGGRRGRPGAPRDRATTEGRGDAGPGVGDRPVVPVPGRQPGQRSAGFHWGELRVTAFDAETHLRPLWFNRTTTRLARAGGEADAWFAAHAEPIPPESLFRTLPGCTVHPFTKGQPVHFGPVFAGLTGHRIVRCQVQDPYLLTAHQMEALAAFVKAVPWGSGGPIAVRLTTHMTENDPTKRFQLSPDDQRRQLETRLGAIPGAKPEIKFRSSKYDPLHMRYAYFQLEEGERLYVLERGLDVADPRGGRARDDSYILEFASIPDTLADVLKLAATKPPG